MKIHPQLLNFLLIASFAIVVDHGSICLGQARTLPLDPNSPSQRDMRSREWALMHISDEVNKHFKKDQLSMFAQVRDDFKRLQVVDNDLMETVFVKNVIDIKTINSSTAEINKRALRLREVLALPKVDSKSKNDKPAALETDLAIKRKLFALDQSIVGFVGSSVFKEPKVLDSTEATITAQNLERIILLSNELKSNLRPTLARKN